MIVQFASFPVRMGCRELMTCGGSVNNVLYFELPAELIILFLFFSGYPGNYSIEIPMFINEEKTIRYRVISVTGVIHTSKMIIDPSFVNLHPVPLNTETRATVQISCMNCLRFEYPTTFSYFKFGTEVNKHYWKWATKCCQNGYE